MFEVQRGFVAVIVPIFGFALRVVIGRTVRILRKNGFLLEWEGNILVHLAQHGVKGVFALQEVFVKVRVNRRICVGILGS